MSKLAGIFSLAKHSSTFMRVCHFQISSTSAFSVKPASSLQEVPWQNFRTQEDNPTLHTSSQIGKFYTIPPDVKNKLFLSGGIPTSLDTLMTSFCESSLMVREQTLELFSYLKKINYSNPVVRFVLHGRLGTGKSVTLAHALHYGYVTKHLILHVPWVSCWTKRPKEIAVSQFNEDRIDLPVDSAMWLQHFKLQNAQLLKELDLRSSRSYTWSKREVTEEGAPLTDIIEHGTVRVRHASDCIAALLKEIKHHTQSGKFKTMLLVDGVNAIWCKTNVRRPNKQLVQADDITIVRAFKKLLDNDWNNGVVISAVDILPHNRHSFQFGPHTPRTLLGKEGFELLTPFVPIETQNYTDKELNSVLDYFCDRKWIQSDKARSEEGRRQIRFLSGSNPAQVMHICNPL